MGGSRDIHYGFFDNVVRGKSALFRLVVKNGFAHFIRKVFARRKLLPGKFGVFAPLPVGMAQLNAGWKENYRIQCIFSSSNAIQE